MSRRLTPTRLVGLLLIVASFSAGWILMDFRSFIETPLALAEPETYVVPSGAGLIAVGQELGDRGILRSPLYLTWHARWQGGANQIVAGEYLLTPGMTPGELLRRLRDGDVIRYGITIPEGWTFRQMLAAIQRHDKVIATLDPDLTDQEVMERLGLAGEHPEGRFFPDTYPFTAGTTDVALLRRAHAAMEARLAKAWAGRSPGLPLKSPYEALVLASIIEKETGEPSERRRIAGVFVRRLQMNMRLQTDPTVIYGLADRFEGRLRTRDLRSDTPYNTYTRRGLPPTPIALPGAASLGAAVDPEEGDALFFVSRGDGTHYFSSTLDVHERAVRKYQLGMSEEVLP